MTFDSFLATAWRDHGDHPREVADRLGASFALVETPEQLAPFVRLLTHVLGEHLGEWQRGCEMLDALRRTRPAARSDVGARAIAIAQATLRWCDGRSDAISSLPPEARAAALAAAASALVERGQIDRAIAAYLDALRDADAAAPLQPSTLRVLAACGNNLAVALEQKRPRTAAQTDAMRVAAEAALRHWKDAGTWLEEERAEYRLARTLLAAGEATAAIGHALRCAEICAANAAPPFEHFFAHAIVAIAHRAAGDGATFAVQRRIALEALEQVSDEEKRWCDSDRRELGD